MGAQLDTCCTDRQGSTKGSAVPDSLASGKRKSGGGMPVRQSTQAQLAADQLDRATETKDVASLVELIDSTAPVQDDSNGDSKAFLPSTIGALAMVQLGILAEEVEMRQKIIQCGGLKKLLEYVTEGGDVPDERKQAAFLALSFLSGDQAPEDEDHLSAAEAEAKANERQARVQQVCQTIYDAGAVHRFITLLNTLPSGHFRNAVETSLTNVCIHVHAASAHLVSSGGFTKLLQNLEKLVDDSGNDAQSAFLADALVNLNDLMVDENSQVNELFVGPSKEFGLLKVLDRAAAHSDEQVRESADNFRDQLKAHLAGQ